MVRRVQTGEPKSKASAAPIGGVQQVEGEAGPYLPREALARPQRGP
jgi:hypothetical protein